MAGRCKIALITGTSSGIGKACVELFQKNYHVIGIDKTPDDGCIAEFYLTDLAKSEEIESALEKICSKHDRIEILVNNAGICPRIPVSETSIEQFNHVLSINTVAPFILCKLCRPLLSRAHGCIINVASVHSECSDIWFCAYATSKGALVSLTRALAAEFANENVRVNALLPGAVDTKLMRDAMRKRLGNDEKIVENAVTKRGLSMPLGRVGQPLELANVVKFLAESSAINGSCFAVDGGWISALRA